MAKPHVPIRADTNNAYGDYSGGFELCGLKLKAA